ncbi:MAG TPA: phage/plasmid primase, P4 family, partial [Thermoguttaceae bacterium]|nr:phage/plasmid primase, P4 family [Thermoguttaceae bacterium]
LPNAGKRRPPVDPAILTDPQWVWLSLPGGSALPDEICNDDDPLPLVAQQNGSRWLGLHVEGTPDQRDDLRRRLAEAVDIEIRGEMLSAAKTPEARVAAIHDELPARPQHPDADVPMRDVCEWSGGDVPAQWTAADFAPLDYWSLYRPGLFHPLDDRYAGPRLPIDEIVSRGVGWDGDVLFSALLLRECKYTRVEAEAALKASGSPWAAKLAEFMDERAVWEWEVFDGSWCPPDAWPVEWHMPGDDWPVEVRIDGEGRRGRVGVVFRSYRREYPDRLDLSDGFQRTQTVKRLAEAWGLPVPWLAWLDQRLAAEAIKQAPDTRAEDDPQGQEIPTSRAAMLRLTDIGNGQRLANLHGNDLRYCWPWSKWLVWSGQRWKLDDVGGVAARAKATVRSIYSEAARAEEDSERKAIAAWARQSERRERVAAMVDLARSEPGIPILPDQLDRDPWVLNCTNGTLDLQTAKLRQHDRMDYLTKLSPVAYQPSAQCPRWDAFLEDIFQANAELVGFVQRLAGYCLTGDVSEQVLPIFHGIGANGKSTLVSTLLEMLGSDYSMKAPADFLVAKRDEAHPTGLADLAGKRLVACQETEDGRRLAESLVKELTGGDPQRARRMREDFWQFWPTHKVILATNHRPAVKGTDYAIWRRLRLVPFNVVIPPDARDKHLLDKLRGELEGILAWSVRGCLEWQRDGLREPGDVVTATDNYRNEEDIVGVFLAESCDQDAETWERGKALYAAYKRHCEDSGEHPVGQRRFGRVMTERGFERYMNNGTCYRGVRVRAE